MDFFLAVSFDKFGLFSLIFLFVLRVNDSIRLNCDSSILYSVITHVLIMVIMLGWGLKLRMFFGDLWIRKLVGLRFIYGFALVYILVGSSNMSIDLFYV